MADMQDDETIASPRWNEQRPPWMIQTIINLGLAKDARTASIVLVCLSALLILGAVAIWMLSGPSAEVTTTEQLLEAASKPQYVP